ncbi:MAG: methyltransferase domain-containing protein [Candidatus Acidiferrum sp.]
MEIDESSSPHRSARSTYSLDNSSREAPARFDALSGLFDRGTIRHLEDRGISEGWRCLEVGGGGGSITSWLANRVGRAGHVVVTDIDPRFLEPLAAENVEVRTHNIVTDPLPDSIFDLIHARLVLVHLPEREKVLTRLVSALKPGGWLVDEEFDSVSLLPDPTVSPGEVSLNSQMAVMRLLKDRGVERRFGRLLYGRLRAHGLGEVGAEGRLFMCRGGSSGVSLMRTNFHQLRGALLDAHYITEQEFDQDSARLDDPDFMAPSPIMWTVWGRRPSA